MNPHDIPHQRKRHLTGCKGEQQKRRYKHTLTPQSCVIKSFYFCRFYDVNDCRPSIPELLQHNIITCTDCDLLKFK